MLHHVMARGAERRAIFRHDHDREAMLGCFAEVARAHDLRILAWALMPNHFHLLVATGEHPLGCCVGALLESFAVASHRSPAAAGRLFEDPFRSVVCEAGRYLIELVRYIHLNPLRAGIVRDFDALEDYPYTGHSALLGNVRRDWQDMATVLARFGRHPGWARAAYRKFAADAVLVGDDPA